jgi:hypothetical protein
MSLAAGSKLRPYEVATWTVTALPGREGRTVTSSASRSKYH